MVELSHVKSRQDNTRHGTRQDHAARHGTMNDKAIRHHAASYEKTRLGKTSQWLSGDMQDKAKRQDKSRHHATRHLRQDKTRW